LQRFDDLVVRNGLVCWARYGSRDQLQFLSRDLRAPAMSQELRLLHVVLLSSVNYTSKSLERGGPQAWPLDFVDEVREAGSKCGPLRLEGVRQTQISEVF